MVQICNKQKYFMKNNNGQGNVKIRFLTKNNQFNERISGSKKTVKKLEEKKVKQLRSTIKMTMYYLVRKINK